MAINFGTGQLDAEEHSGRIEATDENLTEAKVLAQQILDRYPPSIKNVYKCDDVCLWALRVVHNHIA